MREEWFDVLIARNNADYSRSQSLLEHATNVAETAAGNLSALGLSSAGELAAWLHDVGKSLRAWQDALDEAARSYDSGKGDHDHRRPLGVPHAPPSAQVVFKLLSPYAKTTVQRACLQIVCMAIAAHHGYLMDVLSPDGVDRFALAIMADHPDNTTGLEQFYLDVISKERIVAIFRVASKEIAAVFSQIPKAADLVGDKAKRARARYFHMGMVARAVYAALIDADRLDAAIFEEGHPQAPSTSDMPNWTLLLDTLEGYLRQFPNEKPIDKKRRFISETCAAAGAWPDSLLALHAPTGGGKTLAGLRLALARAAAKQRRRIFYVVSYTTILDQVYGDYLEALKGSSCQPNILLHHSNIIPEEAEEQSGKAAGEDQRYHQLLFAERWDADIILTTQVQFLNALFLGTARAARRLRGLQDAVIIFDEVQTVSPGLLHLFNMAVNFLTTICRCDVVLSSATQPSYGQLAFPMLTSRNIFADPDRLFSDMRRVRLIDRRDLGWLDAESLACFAVQQQALWHSVLIVLNTRAAARKVFDMLTALDLSDVDLYLLSNDLCPAHRQRIIRHLKESDRPSICVSTQLIECGVNLSFGCAIRSLAGADNIWQTAGRCNRHDDGKIHPVYIIRCVEENLDKLRDIQAAQKATDKLLHHLADADLLQLPSNMTKYYREYYQMQERQLSYPVRVDDRCSSMVELLGDNALSMSAMAESFPDKKPTQPLRQAFTTAGRAFSVIDSPAIALITPYGEGERIILDLNSNPRLLETRLLLRKAQLYSINIFRYQLLSLHQQGALLLLPCGAYAIRKEWYDSQHRGLLQEPEYDTGGGYFY